MWYSDASLTDKLIGDAEHSVQKHPDVIASYMRFITVPLLILTLMSNGIANLSMVQWCAVLAAWVPSIPVVWAWHLMYIMNFPQNMPRYFCEDYWTFLLNCGGLLALSPFMFEAFLPKHSRTADMRHAAATEYMLVMRIQYWIIWAGVACWKMNSSFMDWRISCAPILMVQLMDWCPQQILSFLGGAEAVATFLVHISPTITVAIEGAIPVLFFFPGRPRCAGIILALLLGLALSLLTEDNATEFSVWCAMRYFLILPASSATALADVWCLPGLFLAKVAQLLQMPTQILPDPNLSAFVFVGLVLAVWPYLCAPLFGSLSWVIGQPYFAIFIGLALILLRAVAVEIKHTRYFADQPAGMRSTSACQKMIRCFVLVVTFAYAFVGPVLGLQDIGLPHMYSNMELHGGSNHLIFPTGLLQAAFTDADLSKGNPFAGGEVLVKTTNSSVLQLTFPAEKKIPDYHRRLLKAAGHIGRAWSPETTEIMGAGVVLGEMLPPTPYTIPALELRRVLEQARLRKEPFFLEYSRYPSKAWGPNTIVNASALPAQIRYETTGLGDHHCENLISSQPCSAGEIILLTSPPVSFMERVVLKLLLSSSYVVAPADFPSQAVGCYNR